MLEEIKFSELNENLAISLKNDWALVTAGNDEKYNTMTVSWGAFGELWGEDTATVYIRPQRYTEEFMNANDYFTICIFPSEMRQQIHSVCGSKSGRDVDKAKECGLTVDFSEKAPFFDEAELVLVCRKMSKAVFNPDDFIDETVDSQWYPDKDYHYVYYGAVEKVLISE